MEEPGRFSIEKIIGDLPLGPATLLAALAAVIATLVGPARILAEIPAIFEIPYNYDRQMQKTVTNRNMLTEGIPVTFVDVDDAAVKIWNKDEGPVPAQLTTPHDKLAAIIAQIVSKRPALLFVDFDLSQSTPNDDALKNLLGKYPSTSPPLLLARSIDPIDCPGGQCASCPADDPTSDNASIVRSLKNVGPNIVWVASVFSPDDDGTVRRWRLWNSSCLDKKLVVWPSPQLAAAAIAGPGKPGVACLRQYLSLSGEPQFATGGKCEIFWPRNTLASNALIPFLIGGSAQNHVSDWMGSSQFRYQRVSALSVLADEVADTAFENRVVVLGASYGPDKFETPFGVMPGAALVSNAIAVAPQILASPPRPYLVKFLGIVLAAIYAFFAKEFRALPAAALIVLCSYIWLTSAALWLNPADGAEVASTALLALGVFLVLDSTLEIVIDLARGRGMAASLRRHSEKSEHKTGGA